MQSHINPETSAIHVFLVNEAKKRAQTSTNSAVAAEVVCLSVEWSVLEVCDSAECDGTGMSERDEWVSRVSSNSSGRLAGSGRTLVL